MHFDFPIETIKFDFEHQGTGQINLYFNNKKIENYLIYKGNFFTEIKKSLNRFEKENFLNRKWEYI